MISNDEKLEAEYQQMLLLVQGPGQLDMSEPAVIGFMTKARRKTSLMLWGCFIILLLVGMIAISASSIVSVPIAGVCCWLLWLIRRNQKRMTYFAARLKEDQRQGVFE